VRAKRTAAAIAATAMALALAACGGGSSDGGSGGSGGASGGGTLKLGAVLQPVTLAAGGAEWANVSPFMQAAYDTLIHLTPDAEPEPWLATDWKYNKNLTVLTMNLRDDVTFIDGEKFNADVAAQNLTRFKEGTSPNASYLANLEEAKATDEFTVQLTLAQPDPALLTYLGQNAGLQASPKSFGAKDEKTNPVGSGPYKIDTGKTVIGSKYVYTKNEDYWAPEQQYYDGLEISILADSQTQVNASRGGQVNALNLLDQSSVDQIESGGFTAFPHELDWSGLALIDREGSQNEALGKLEVRQAINHAIDRDAMLKAVAKGRGTVTGQIFNPTTAAYDESLDETYPFDPEKAKQLLADAGYPDGVELEMPLVNIGGTAVYDLMEQYLADVGITVKYTDVPLADAIAQILAPKFPAFWLTLQMDPTPWQAANFAITENATFNPFHVKDPTVDKLVSTIQTGDEADADAAAQELNTYVVDNAWFAPWYRVESNFMADANTDVVQQSDNAYPYLWNIKPKA
jgi:peptide/nickel transport system substrate-binding protein